MLTPKYMVVQHANRPARGIGLSVVSNHWFKWAAQLRVYALEAQQAAQPDTSLAASYTWRVDARCK